jgi:hypothetical protein
VLPKEERQGEMGWQRASDGEEVAGQNGGRSVALPDSPTALPARGLLWRRWA